jgi:hypothetical protein
MTKQSTLSGLHHATVAWVPQASCTCGHVVISVHTAANFRSHWDVPDRVLLSAHAQLGQTFLSCSLFALTCRRPLQV